MKTKNTTNTKKTNDDVKLFLLAMSILAIPVISIIIIALLFGI